MTTDTAPVTDSIVAHTYTPLGGPDHIRYLHINKDPTLRPSCTTDSYSLKHRIAYTALSYTWGNSAPEHNILLNGERHEVPQNLFDFIQAYLTHPWGLKSNISLQNRAWTGYFWIDQMCIDQSNASERSAQVSMMNTIFKEARDVLVWLGCDAIMVETARKIRDRAPDQGAALRTLLKHPYFSRLWIVQEVALAKKISIVCGDVHFGWSRLKELLRSEMLTVATLHEGPSFSRQASAVVLEYEPTHTLERCISLYYANECQDQRDKLYGLLGMTSERWRVKVDYTKPVIDVYLDAVMALCEELRDILDLACFYPRARRASVSAAAYRATLLTLGQQMNLSPHHLRGLDSFIAAIQAILSTTHIRNVRYVYSGWAFHTRPRSIYFPHAESNWIKRSVRKLFGTDTPRINLGYSDDQPLWPEWQRTTITATRKNPFVRDVIPRMGLQLAASSTHSSLGQRDRGLGPNCDRWWFEHNGRDHFFDCEPSTESE